MLLRKVTALRSNGMSDVYNALVTTSTLSTWDKPAIDAAAEAAVPQPADGANAAEVRGRNQHVKAMKKWLRRKEWLGNHDALLILHTVWCDGTNGRRFHKTTGRRNEYGWTWLGYIEDDGSVAIYHRDGGSTKYADLDAAHAVLKNCMLVTRDGLNGHIYVSDYKVAEMHEVFHQDLDVAHTMLIRTVIEERRATIGTTSMPTRDPDHLMLMTDGRSPNDSTNINKIFGRLFETLEVDSISTTVLRKCLATEFSGSADDIVAMQQRLSHGLRVHFEHYITTATAAVTVSHYADADDGESAAIDDGESAAI
jgi:hypothetical protein